MKLADCRCMNRKNEMCSCINLLAHGTKMTRVYFYPPTLRHPLLVQLYIDIKIFPTQLVTCIIHAILLTIGKWFAL